MRKTPFTPDEWYHCLNRGVDKRIIFENRRDYERFLMLLYVCNSSTPVHISNIRQDKQGPTLLETLEQKRGEPLVEVSAYSLMPNHYHLLLRERQEGGITTFMRKVATGYTMYFNIKRERTGALFSGKFKSRHVEKTTYLRRLLNYIHANPAELYEKGWKKGRIANEKELKRLLQTYEYSSLQEYLGRRRPLSKIISAENLLSIFNKRPHLEDLIEEARIFARSEE